MIEFLRGVLSLTRLPVVGGVVETEWITVVDGDKDGSEVCLFELTGGDNVMLCWPWKTALVGVDIGVVIGEQEELQFVVDVAV